jgi:hypothetical protein
VTRDDCGWSDDALRSPIRRVIEGRFLVKSTQPFLFLDSEEQPRAQLSVPASTLPASTIERLEEARLQERIVTVSATPLGRAPGDGFYLAGLRSLELDDGKKVDTHWAPHGADYASLSDARATGSDAIGKTVHVALRPSPTSHYEPHELVAGGPVGWAAPVADWYDASAYSAAPTRLALGGLSDNDLSHVIGHRPLKVRIDGIVPISNGEPDLRLTLVSSAGNPPVAGLPSNPENETIVRAVAA